MTSRRNFVIGAGTLLTGSGTFLGSGAFGVGNARNPENWVPVGVRTPSSAGFESSLGFQQGDDGADGSGGGSDSDDGQGPGGETGEDDGGTGSDDSDGDGDGGGDDNGGEDGTDGDRDAGSDDLDGIGGNDPGGGSDGTDTGGTGGGRGTGGGTGGTGGSDNRGNGNGGNGTGGSSGGGGDGSSGETSLRLEAGGSDVLSSDHVLTAEDGTLRGLRLENLNMDARTYVGEASDGRFPDPTAGDRVAFLVVNDGDVAVDLSVDVNGTAPEVLNFPAWVDAGVSGPRQRDLTAVQVAGLPPGGVVRVVVEVDTTVVDPVPDDAVEAVTFVADPV